MRVAVRSPFASRIAVVLGLAGLLVASSPLRAVEPAAPSVSVAVAGADELMADVQYLLGLTDTTEQKQFKILKDYLEVFLIGVDKKLATRVDVMFDTKANRLVWSIPVSKFTQFRKDNIAAILTPHIKQDANDKELWKLGNGKPADFNGWMRFVTPYARIGETKDDIAAVPADPRPWAASLLKQDVLLGVDIQNKVTDAAAQAKRKELFQTTRKQSLGALKKEKGEAAADFELRKKAAEIEMDELEWYFTEAEHAVAGVSIDRKQGVGRLNFELTPIANTSLAQSVLQLSTKASYFANVERSKQPTLAFSINHPLGEIRKKTATAMSALVRDRLKARIDGDEKRSADQKEAGKQLIDKGYALVESGIAAGNADGFIDVHAGANGKNVMLVGARTGDGTKLEEVVNLIPKAYEAATVKLNAAEESGVKIHSIEFAKGKHPAWSDFIGADLIYVGSSKDTLWAAAGEGALDSLKNAIKKTKQPAAAGSEKGPWAEMIVRLKPWIDEAAAQPPKKKGDDHYPKLMKAALAGGDDQLSVKVTRQDNKIVGEVVLQKGLLRIAGKVAADFSRENLDETNQKSSGSKRAQK